MLSGVPVRTKKQHSRGTGHGSGYRVTPKAVRGRSGCAIWSLNHGPRTTDRGPLARIGDRWHGSRGTDHASRTTGPLSIRFEHGSRGTPR